jgi:hypothetical protein
MTDARHYKRRLDPISLPNWAKRRGFMSDDMSYARFMPHVGYLFKLRALFFVAPDHVTMVWGLGFGV